MLRSRGLGSGKDTVRAAGSSSLSRSKPGAKTPAVFLKSLFSRMKGVSAFFLLQNLRDTQSSPKTTVCWRPNAGRRITAIRNLWLIRCELILTAGVAGSCGVCAEQDLDWTEYVAGQVSKGASLLQSEDGRPVSRLTVLRPKGSGECPPSFIQQMRKLAPILRHDLKHKGPRVELKMQKQVAADLLERIPFGVILLDAKRDVVLQNKSAQEILKIGTPGRKKRDAAPLDMIRSALNDGFLARFQSGGCFCLFQPAVSQRMCVFAYRVAPGSYVGEDKPATALFLTDPARKDASSIPDLMQRYGVTRAEARLAAKLTQNNSIAESARLLGISVNTARNQLKRIFDKTGTRRQIELLNLLLSPLPARRP